MVERGANQRYDQSSLVQSREARQFLPCASLTQERNPMKIYPKIALLVLFTVATAFAARALLSIAVAVGPNEFPTGDSVTIVEVLSDSPGLEIGSRVVVRGRYTLSSQAQARVGLSLTRTESRAPVPILPGSNMPISKGSGDFELVYEVT
jgi:hypothetical protein